MDQGWSRDPVARYGVSMDQVRRGWSPDKEGWWWHHAIRSETHSTFAVKVTEGGEETLFGLYDDKSKLEVADVIQYATHMDISFEGWVLYPALRDCIEKLNEVLQTADNPAPSLEALNIWGLNDKWPVLNAIKSKKLYNLKCLNLLFREGEDGEVELLASAIDADCLPSLSYLKLGGVCPGSSEHISLAKVMKSGRMLTLQTLLLSWHDVEDAGWEAYADAINSGKLPSLKWLNLSGIRDIRAIETIGRAIESGELKNLTELDLSKTELDRDIQTGHFILAEQMGSGRMRALETLNLSRTRMKDESCEAYANAIISGELPSLSCIRFSWNSLRDKGAEALGRAIRSGELKNLAELTLDFNRITDEGMTLLANAYQVGEASILPNIRSISLDLDALRGLGSLSLAEALKSGRLDSLESFTSKEKGYRVMSDEGANAMVSAFSSNIHLTVNVVSHWYLYGFPDLGLRVYQLRERNLRFKDISAGLQAGRVIPASFGKIYLCGSPGVGKTTLRRTLQRSHGVSLVTREGRRHVEKHTRGIDVSQFSSQSNKQGQNPITMLVWDMAGQEDYHVVHNAFFPDLGSAEGKATSFVVVCGSKSIEMESKQQVHRLKNHRQDSKQQVDYWLQQLVYWLKFIASSCGKSTDRRHVFIVLNNFDGELKVSKYSQIWEYGLEILKEDFKDYLDIQTDAFIVDVRKYLSVRPLKRCLLEHSSSLLKDQMIPDICQFIQKNLSHWSETREQFPVIRWTDFVDKVQQSSNEPWPVETLIFK